MTSIGWDIGGVHLKVARIAADGRITTRMVPLPLAHGASTLAPSIRGLTREVGTAPVHGVTMTGELSQRFRTKAEGVDFILGAMEKALPDATLQVLGTDGHFMSPAMARQFPLLASASNWVATATLLAREWPDAIMVDMGSTTTDIIPIAEGVVAARGRTDPERLMSGELVYTGLLRTRAEAIVREVPWRGGQVRVAPDDFALVADAHLWNGTIGPDDCTQPMADGGPATREAAGDRLARLACADRTMMSDDDIALIAGAIAEAQLASIAAGMSQVRGQFPQLTRAIVLGQGEQVAAAAARLAGLEVVSLAREWGRDASTAAPSVAVARLVASHAACAAT